MPAGLLAALVFRLVASNSYALIVKIMGRLHRCQLFTRVEKDVGGILTEKLDDILRRVDSLPTLETRPEAEILGYDDQGVPR